MNLSQNLNFYQFPAMFRIKDKAKFLTRNLPVTLCQAQEMISFYYGCENWLELQKCVKASTKPNRLERVLDNIDAGNYRKQVCKLLSSNWGTKLSNVHRTKIIPDTILHSLVNNNLMKLYDEEIIDFYESIYEGETTPQNDLHTVLNRVDNSILTSIFSNLKNTKQNEHMTDHRFGFTFYYNFQINGDSLRLVIRELDTLFRPPTEMNFYHSLYKKEWFLNYTYGYLKYLINSLKTEFKSGEVVLHRVYNHDCIITDCSPHQVNPNNMSHLRAYLISIGGTIERLLGSDDPRKGVTLRF